MSKRPFLPMVFLFFAFPLSSQSMGTFLPPRAAPKAARLLAAIDDYSAEIGSRRGRAREAQLKAEFDAVRAYALIAASRSSRSSWADPEGKSKAADAGAAFAVARARGRKAALVLATGEDVKAQVAGLGEAVPGESTALQVARAAAADSLSALILASGIGEKAAIALERYLAGKARDLEQLFPEAIEVESLLRKSGAAGAREAAAALAHGSADVIARSLSASKTRILQLVPASASALVRLESASDAYRAWIASFPIAAYPGDLGSATKEERAILAASLVAISSLGAGRASVLFESMSKGDGRDSAAAEAARRLAEVWTKSSAAGRRELASLCASSESSMAAFAVAGAEGGGRRASFSAKASPPPATDPLAAIAALDDLEIAIADQEVSPGGAASGAEPALLLLERPELAAIAKRETRYASLNAEASRRLEALYAQAAEGAQARLESSAEAFKAASLALGSSPTGMVVTSVDLGLPHGETGRWIAFFATATDASGSSISLPLRSPTAGAEYAASFSRSAGLGPGRGDPSAILARYAQAAICAYDPEGSKAAYVLDAYPKSNGPALLDDTALELALLGAWRP